MTDAQLIFVVFWLGGWTVFFIVCMLAVGGLSSSEEDFKIIMNYENELREAKEKKEKRK